MRARSAPHRSIAAIVASSTPVAAPRQPAWAAPMTPACCVGEQHRAAIGGGHPDGEAGRPGHDGVGARTLLRAPRPLDRHDVGRMDLIGGEEAIRPHPERRRHAGAVLGDLGGRVVGARAAVEARIDAVGHAAVAREEGVADAGERGERGGLQHARHWSRGARGLDFCGMPTGPRGSLRLRSRAGPRASGRTRRAP